MSVEAFAKAMIRAAWEGCDGGDLIQEEAVKYGLIKCVPFDPEVHTDPTGYCTAGDIWFVFDGPLAAAIRPAQQPPHAGDGQ
jgi:hypothetical protein